MLIYEAERHKIIGAAYNVINTLGTGFTEYIYQDALEIEFQLQNIPYEREKRLYGRYKGIELRHDYKADFVCFDKIIVECKAVEEIAPAHKAQVINYLKLSDLKLGIILNFAKSRIIPEILFSPDLTTDYL